MLIVITGVPGTGKTTISAQLGKKLNFNILHLREFVKQKKLSSKFQNENLVDLKKLKKELIKEIEKQEYLIIEGHLACEIPLPTDFVFVLRCNPCTLEKRLKKRKYSKEKIKENLLAEMLDYCVQVAETHYKGKRIIEIETAGAHTNYIVTKIIRIISEKNAGKNNHISYTNELERFLGLVQL